MISKTWRDREGLLSLDRITPRQARALLCAVVTLVGLGLALALLRPSPTAQNHVRHSDAHLYEAVISDVARGQSYYAAAAREHRLGDAPLHPFLAVRPPCWRSLLRSFLTPPPAPLRWLSWRPPLRRPGPGG